MSGSHIALDEANPLREYALGSERWVCAWWTETDEPGQDDFTVHLDEHSRAYPSQALAVSFARRVADYYGAPMVRRERFEKLDRHSGLIIGSWEPAGEWEEVVPDQPSGVRAREEAGR